jgi:signal peptidase I
VVGLPGDRIAIVGGRVIRNGTPAREPFIIPCRPGDVGADFPKPVAVPAGMYFVLGDNRCESNDSRFYGPVKRAWIVGVMAG